MTTHGLTLENMAYRSGYLRRELAFVRDEIGRAQVLLQRGQTTMALNALEDARLYATASLAQVERSDVKMGVRAIPVTEEPNHMVPTKELLWSAP